MTEPTAIVTCPPKTLSFTLSDLMVVTTAPAGAFPARLDLNLVLGPSFVVGDGWVVNALGAVSGRFEVGTGSGAARWRIIQWSFADQGPRMNYEVLSESISVVLPVAFVSDGNERRVNALLVLSGRRVGASIEWQSLRFSLDELVRQAFPSNPDLRTLVDPVMVSPK